MKKLVIIFTVISFLFGGFINAQNSDFEAYKKAQQAEFENFKKAQQAEFDAFNKAKQAEFDTFTKKRNVFAKTVLFEGTDGDFFENQNFIQKLDSQIFSEIVKKECKNCIYADTIFFCYNSNNWERNVVVKVHSNVTKLPLSFSVSGVGTTFGHLLLEIESNLSSIKYTMEVQEKEAVKGNPNYEYIK